MSVLRETIGRLSTLLQSFNECRISSYNGSRLIIIGCWELGYHHNFEAEFVEVSYVQCPTLFSAQSFRLANSSEREQLNLADYCWSQEDTLFCFETDGRQFFVAAQGLKLREGLVSDYKLTQ